MNSKKRKIRELEEEIEELKKNEKTKTENFSEFSPSASKKFRLAVENSSVEKTEKNFTSIHENEKAAEEKNEENSMETDEEKVFCHFFRKKVFENLWNFEILKIKEIRLIFEFPLTSISQEIFYFSAASLIKNEKFIFLHFFFVFV